MRVMMNTPWVQRAIARAFGVQGRPPVELDSAASPTVQLAQLDGGGAGLILDHTPVVRYYFRAAVVGERSFVAVVPAPGKVLVIDSVVLTGPGAGEPAIGVDEASSWVPGLFLDVDSSVAMVAMRGPAPLEAASRVYAGSTAAAALANPQLITTVAAAGGGYYPPTWGNRLWGEGLALYGGGDDDPGWRALIVQNGVVNTAVGATFTGREYDYSQWLSVQ